MRCQDLPFLEKLARANLEPLWFHFAKEQKNTRIRYIDKFYKDIHVNIVLCLNLSNNYSSFGLRKFLGHSDP